MKYDALVYGPMFCDLVFTGLPGMPVLGEEHYADDLTIAPGGSAIVAIGLQRLGIHTGLIADLGTDPLSSLLWRMLEEHSLDRSLIRRLPHPLPQVTVALSFPEDRAFITRFRRAEEPRDVEKIFEIHKAEHLHVGSFLPVLENPHVFSAAQQAGMTVSLDPGWDEKALRDPVLMAALKDLDFFLPSRSELCFLARDENPDQAARAVLDLMDGGSVIMKDGGRGASAYSPSNPGGIHRQALEVDVVDTTGAGDAFDAGFIAALLEGRLPEVCLQHGLICGSLAVTARGGLGSLPDREELQKWL
jgi:sugar/nucleoside kinase (ribokinase family)